MTDSPQDLDERYQWVLDMDLCPTSPEQLSQSTDDIKAPASLSAKSDTGLAHILAKVPLFRGIHAPHLKKLLRLCTPVVFARGERICTMGDPSDSVLLLLSGELEVLMDDEVSVATVRPVTTVGEMSYVTKWPRSVSLVAAKECAMMKILNTQLHALLLSDRALHLRMLENIVTIMAARIVGLNDHMRRQLLDDREGGSERD